jgi:hypothetical protein
VSEREIRAALAKICSELDLRTRRGLIRPGVRAALAPIALGAGLAAIACSAEPLLAEGGQVNPTAPGTGGVGGTGGGSVTTTESQTQGGAGQGTGGKHIGAIVLPLGGGNVGAAGAGGAGGVGGSGGTDG